MFGIRRRWPVLTATGAALLYVVNNYQLTGLEHLHVQPLGASRQLADAGTAATGDDVQSDPFGIDLTQFGINTSASLGDNFRLDRSGQQTASPAPPWNQLLSMGEKLALWQDTRSPGGSPSATDPLARPAFPASSPIPLPLGFVAPTSTLPSTSARPSTASPKQVAVASGTREQPMAADAIPGGVMTSLGKQSLEAAPVPPANFGAASGNRPHTIRIASFQLPALGPDLLNKPQILQLLVSILKQYDVVALQGIQSDRDDLLPLIVEKLNQSGRSFDYLIGPRVGRGAPHQQFAYVFETSCVETDRYQLYSVDDPEDLISREPLVAWFRCKGVPATQAFTFTLINVSIDPLFADAERAVLPRLIEAIQRDGRQEDDWIMLGNFAGGNAQLSMLEASGVRLAISDTPTDVVGSQMLDTIVFSTRATTEFNGRAGVFDFLRKHNLSIEQAFEVSQHMPVWAEFTCLEGAQPGRIAPAAVYP